MSTVLLGPMSTTLLSLAADEAASADEMFMKNPTAVRLFLWWCCVLCAPSVAGTFVCVWGSRANHVHDFCLGAPWVVLSIYRVVSKYSIVSKKSLDPYDRCSIRYDTSIRCIGTSDTISNIISCTPFYFLGGPNGSTELEQTAFISFGVDAQHRRWKWTPTCRGVCKIYRSY